MSYNRCKDTHKFGNKYFPSAYKTQVDFRSHFSGKSASYSPRSTAFSASNLMGYSGLVSKVILDVPLRKKHEICRKPKIPIITYDHDTECQLKHLSLSLMDMRMKFVFSNWYVCTSQ